MQTQCLADSDRRHRLQLHKQIAWGKWTILAILAVTLINQVLLWFGAKYHFLISAAMPYYLNWLAGQLGGAGVKAVATVLTVLLYAGYGVCVMLCGDRREWMSAAVSLFGVDTLVLCIFAFTMLENPASCVLEILTHLALMAPLINAIRAYDQLERRTKHHRRGIYIEQV